MSLNPSNQISKQITGTDPFPNLAGMGERDHAGVDAICEAELNAAGIKVERWEVLRDQNEPHTAILGTLHNLWSFSRAWYYWIVKGPGLPVEDAMALHAVHGTSVRVNGDCTCPSPIEQNRGFPVGMYHVDNADGLKALVAAINAVKARSDKTLNP